MFINTNIIPYDLGNIEKKLLLIKDLVLDKYVNCKINHRPNRFCYTTAHLLL